MVIITKRGVALNWNSIESIVPSYSDNDKWSVIAFPCHDSQQQYTIKSGLSTDEEARKEIINIASTMCLETMYRGDI